MRHGVQLGMQLSSGMLLYKMLSWVLGLLLLPTLGMILNGQYLQAGLQLCAIVALHRGVWWVVTRRRRRA